MARLIPSSLVTGVRGSIGNETFSYWRKGVYTVKTKAHVVAQPNTMPQLTSRLAMAIVAPYWRETLTQAQRDEWNTFANSNRDKDSKAGGMRAIIHGNTRTGSGYHSFLELNLNAFSAKFFPPPKVITPPWTERVPDGIADLVAFWTDPPGTKVDLTWTDPADYPLTSKVRIWLRSPDNVFHRQITTTMAPVAGMASIIEGKSVGGANILFNTLADGVQLYFQVDVCSPNGQLSTPSNTSIAIVT